jgi:hypothetical protein
MSWPALFMVARMLCGGRQSCSGLKKKIQPFDDCVVRMMIYGHRLSMLFLFLKWPACSVFSNKFRQHSGKGPTEIRRQLNFTFLQFFYLLLCHQLVLLVANLFYLSLANFCISQQVSDDASAKFFFFFRNCFPAKLGG